MYQRDNCMKRNYVVYMHTHRESGKKYIGITGMKPEHRWSNGKGYTSGYFHHAIEKDGWDMFVHEILFSELTKDEACEKECELIAKYKSNNPEYGYNCSVGGEMSALGAHWELSEETKQKMRKPKSDEHRERIRKSKKGSKNPLFGKHLSDEHRKKISKSGTGRRLTEEHRDKLSGSNNYKSKKVGMYDVNTGLLIAIWDSTGQASKELGISQQNISACCLHKPKRKTVGGYRWEYLSTSEVM